MLMKIHEFQRVEDLNNFLAKNKSKKFTFKTENTNAGVLYFAIEQEDIGINKERFEK